MFTRADIRRVSMAVARKDYGALIVSLGKNGLVHIDREIPGETAGALNNAPGARLTVNTLVAEKILSAGADFFSESGNPQYDIRDRGPVLDDISLLFAADGEADLRDAGLILRKIKQYARVRAALLKDMETAENRLSELSRMRQAGIDLAELRGLRYISYIYGRAYGSAMTCCADKRVFYIAGGDYILAMFPSALKDDVRNELARDRFEDLDHIIRPGNTAGGEEAATAGRIAELRGRLARIDSFFDERLPQWRERMIRMAAVYSTLLEISGAERKLLFSEELVIINGWINSGDGEKLRNLLRDACGGRFYLKTGSRMESRRLRNIVPVLLKNNPLLRPFELLVKMMGVPGNSEVDPTPAAALAYVVIFGVMFGDAGQGLVLALSGFILNRYGMRKHGRRNNISDFGSIMTWCGLSAATFGLLYGSVFSNEHLLPALLFHPMERMMDLLLMAIMTGTVFISCGLLLNIVNGMIAGHYGESLFGSRGVAGLAVYISFIFFAFRYILTGRVPAAADITLMLAVPVGLFCMRGPLEYILFHGGEIFPHGLFEYVVETLIEIIEMFSGFLGNTISYIRAGAFALSHAGLSMAVYTLAGMVDPSMRGVAALSVIAAGNLFIILLEGLVCGIQSMRLEYYEFFGKFYKGDGVAFAPFSLGFKHVKDGGFK